MLRDRCGQPCVRFGPIVVLAGLAAPPQGCFPTGRCAAANLEAVRRMSVRRLLGE